MSRYLPPRAPYLVVTMPQMFAALAVAGVTGLFLAPGDPANWLTLECGA